MLSGCWGLVPSLMSSTAVTGRPAGDPLEEPLGPPSPLLRVLGVCHSGQSERCLSAGACHTCVLLPAHQGTSHSCPQSPPHVGTGNLAASLKGHVSMCGAPPSSAEPGHRAALEETFVPSRESRTIHPRLLGVWAPGLVPPRTSPWFKARPASS
ncbi:hypothetical protein H1C71_008098 [Ictidomys tridecemlineatus]|nr:hypothetical protein H1C71_008098 [Ictidomys tridecemlineatus]